MELYFLDYFEPTELYVRIPPLIREELLGEIQCKKMSKVLGVSRRSLSAYKHGDCGIPLDVFLAIMKYLGISPNKYEDLVKVRFGRYGRFSPFPLKLSISPEWIYFSELLRTDGHISKDKLELKLVNTEKSLIDIFLQFLDELDFENFRYEENDNDYRVRVFNKTFSELLYRAFSIQSGKKSLKTSIPDWFRGLNYRYTVAGLRGAFDGDGGVQHTGRTRRIRLSTGSQDYAQDIQYLLLRLGIDSKVFSDPREDKNLYYVQISKKKYIQRFYSHIGFHHPSKHSSLREICESYTRLTVDEVNKKIREIVGLNPGITNREIAEILGKSESTVSSHLIRLESENVLKRVPHKQKKLTYLA